MGPAAPTACRMAPPDARSSGVTLRLCPLEITGPCTVSLLDDNGDPPAHWQRLACAVRAHYFGSHDDIPPCVTVLLAVPLPRVPADPHQPLCLVLYLLRTSDTALHCVLAQPHPQAASPPPPLPTIAELWQRLWALPAMIRWLDQLGGTPRDQND